MCLKIKLKCTQLLYNLLKIFNTYLQKQRRETYNLEIKYFLIKHSLYTMYLFRYEYIIYLFFGNYIFLRKHYLPNWFAPCADRRVITI